jgi:hypothetical protein
MSHHPAPDPERLIATKADLKWQDTDRLGGREITPRQARILSRHILKHPGLQDVPGVPETRKALFPRINVRTNLLHKIAPTANNTVLAATNIAGMTLFSKDAPITVGTVTHEVTHKIMGRRSMIGIPIGDHHGPEFRELHHKIVDTAVNSDSASRLKSFYQGAGLQ